MVTVTAAVFVLSAAIAPASSVTAAVGAGAPGRERC